MVTASFRMKAIPKGTSNLETQLACHLYPGAASKIKMIHGDNPADVRASTPGGVHSQGRESSSRRGPHLPLPARSKQPSKCLLAESVVYGAESPCLRWGHALFCALAC